MSLGQVGRLIADPLFLSAKSRRRGTHGTKPHHRVVIYSNIVILDRLSISPLSKVKVRLCEDILQILIIRVLVTSIFHKVIPPNLEGVNHDS
jgi:hypothetical protein